MRAFDPQTVVLFAAVGWLMAYAGIGKKQLKLRAHKPCRHCGLRHAPGNCATLRH